MTLPVSGAISFNNINVELGVAGTTQASLGQSSYRTLAGVASGAISMSNFYGKSNRAAISYTFSANTANASLNLSTISGYAAGTSDITVTINSGIYVYSTSTGGYGLALSGATTGDTVTIVNNGYIMGMGGGYGSINGGPAINVASIGVSSFTVTNTSGYIGGGGGAGAGRGSGGGAGGGQGLTFFGAGGGAGGGVGASGSQGPSETGYIGKSTINAGGGGGGGRIMPGTGGAGGTAGAWPTSAGKGGGSGGGGGRREDGIYNGAAGGSAGSAGGNSPQGDYAGSGGGGWGASGGTVVFYTAGTGGKAINLGGKSITWTGGASSSSRAYGAVS